MCQLTNDYAAQIIAAAKEDNAEKIKQLGKEYVTMWKKDIQQLIAVVETLYAADEKQATAGKAASQTIHIDSGFAQDYGIKGVKFGRVSKDWGGHYSGTITRQVTDIKDGTGKVKLGGKTFTVTHSHGNNWDI